MEAWRNKTQWIVRLTANALAPRGSRADVIREDHPARGSNMPAHKCKQDCMVKFHAASNPNQNEGQIK